jgi:hypothetical protein
MAIVSHLHHLSFPFIRTHWNTCLFLPSLASWCQIILPFSLPYLMRVLSMRFAFSALITYLVSRFRSDESLRLENIALRHQLFVYQRTIKRPKLCSSDRLFWAGLSRLWLG